MGCVLITGTSSGIGLETALELARAGHTVCATMRNMGRAQTLCDLAAQEGIALHVSEMDVDSDASVREGIARVRERWGFIETLVNNAGIERIGAIEELPLEAFRQAMETNYFGALRTIQAVLPEMRERPTGCIVNVSSVAGRIAPSPMGPYTASKWALEALSEVLAQEARPFGIRVAIVEPGIIDTAMARRIETPDGASVYPQPARFAAMFRASLAAPEAPLVVAAKIRAVIESGTWQLRHPVGANAAPFLGWRASMSDEQFADWGALDDDEWYVRVEQEFGLKARPAKPKAATAGSPIPGLD